MSDLLIPALQPEAMPLAPVRPSPCTLACPAGINVKGYVSLMAEGRHAEALETIRRRCPLPAICGRVCHHPCEKACRRGRYDDPVAIRSLKRFAADFARFDPPPPPPIAHEHRIAVIGSGPAGLTAAYDLRMAGYAVTVFEGAPEPGGMLRYGIADYRLPRDVLDAEIDALCRAGVEIRTGEHVGDHLELDDLMYRGYAVTLLAVGAQRGRALEGAEDALSFLRAVKNGDRARVEGRVLVIGGGSTAVEAARTALRLGAASVEILYRRYREELLADKEEIEAAEAEGVRFRFLIAPIRALAGGLECVQIGLGEPDASGRRRPIEIPGSNVIIPAEHVYAAVGQKVDTTFLPSDLVESIAGRDRLLVNEKTLMTSIGGIFAAGDAVTGPATVVEAIGSGHRAAESIRHFLEEGAPDVREQKPERRAPVEYELKDPEPVRAERVHPELREAAADFAEVERSFTEEEAISEARRCLRCGPCGECRSCAPSCTRRHVMVDDMLLRVPAGMATSLPADRPTAATLDGAPVSVVPVRCRVDDARCRACGRCLEVCPFQALRIVDEHIQLDAARCRGCGLCTAVCPTATVVLSAPPHIPDSEHLVLACQRRTGAEEGERPARSRGASRAAAGDTVAPHEQNGHAPHVVRLRCIGQLDAGVLIDLQRNPDRKIVVAGCESARCRFTTGARHAAEQLERARAIARALGLGDGQIVEDWSPDRLHDPLDALIAGTFGGEA